MTYDEDWQVWVARLGVAAFRIRHRALYRLARYESEHYLAPAFFRVKKIVPHLPADPEHAVRLARRAARFGAFDAARRVVGRNRPTLSPHPRTILFTDMRHAPNLLAVGDRRNHSRADEAVDMLDRLKPRERNVLLRYFGIGYPEQLNMREIGDLLGVGHTRISQMITFAILELRGKRPVRWSDVPKTRGYVKGGPAQPRPPGDGDDEEDAAGRDHRPTAEDPRRTGEAQRQPPHDGTR